MKSLSLLTALIAVAVPALVSAQSTKNIEDKLKVHPRRLAFNNKDGRHQVRVLSKKNRHNTRREVRKVTHKLTKPHKKG